MSDFAPKISPSFSEIKQQLLPLTPLQAALEALVEHLPRHRLQMKLKPLSQIQVQNEAIGTYVSTGNSPTFSVITTTRWIVGWYYFETALARNSGSRSAYINCYADGRSHSSSEPLVTIPIASNLRGTVREVIFIPAGVHEIEWIPTQSRGPFKQDPILLHRICNLESGLRRWHRVLSDIWRFRQLKPQQRNGLTFPDALRNLHAAYSASTLCRLKRLSGFDYSSYVAQSERQNKVAIPALYKQIAARPKIVFSIVLVLDQTDSHTSILCLESLKAQRYIHWELLLVGRCSEEVFSRACVLFTNRRVVRLPHSNTTLPKQFNSAMELSTGGHILRVNSSGTLAVDALIYFADIVGKSPSVNIIYCDDDCLNTSSGERATPRFRPDWNPELLRSCQYMGECIAYSKEILMAVGGFRDGFESAEDYDLLLRTSAICDSKDIQHIPKVLYHRHPTGETANQISPDHQAIAKRALQNSLKTVGVSVTDGPGPGLFRIHYAVPEILPLVSIIVPTRDRADLLQACVSSVQGKTDYANWELIIVDNGSTELATHDYFHNVQCLDQRVRVLKFPGHFNYSSINNHAAKECRGEVLVLLNNDVEVISSNWLHELVGHAIRPGIGAVGAKLLYSDNTVQHAGVVIGMGGIAGHVHRFIEHDAPGYCNRAIVAQNLSAVTGACLAIVKERLLMVGGLDEKLAVAFNDVDLCLRLVEAGMRNVFTPWALLYHHESLSRGTNDSSEKQALFERECTYMKVRWGKNLDRDAAWNRYGDVIQFGC